MYGTIFLNNTVFFVVAYIFNAKIWDVTQSVSDDLETTTVGMRDSYILKTCQPSIARFDCLR